MSKIISFRSASVTTTASSTSSRPSSTRGSSAERSQLKQQQQKQQQQPQQQQMRLPPRPSAAPPPPAPPTGLHPAWPSDPSVGPIPLSLHASAGSGLSNHFGRSPVFKNSSFDAQLALLRTQMVSFALMSSLSPVAWGCNFEIGVVTGGLRAPSEVGTN